MRYHRGLDPHGRDSYKIPDLAIVGASDCGMDHDSPCPTDEVDAELFRFQKDLMQDKGILSKREQPTSSGNVHMIKQWVVVEEENFIAACKYALTWCKKHQSDTRLIHDADLRTCYALVEMN